MTPEQAPKELYHNGSKWCDSLLLTPDKHPMSDYPNIKYIRADRVELMVILAVLEYKYDMWLSVHSAMDNDPIFKEIQTIKEQLQ